MSLILASQLIRIVFFVSIAKVYRYSDQLSTTALLRRNATKNMATRCFILSLLYYVVLVNYKRFVPWARLCLDSSRPSVFWKIALNFRSSFNPSKTRAIFFSSISISILFEQVNFRAIRAKIRAILCLVSTLVWDTVSTNSWK